MPIIGGGGLGFDVENVKTRLICNEPLVIVVFLQISSMFMVPSIELGG